MGSGDLPRENVLFMVASMYVFNAFWMRFLPQFQPALADFEQAALVYPLNGTLA